MAYGDFKDLAKRTASDKDLKFKAFDIPKIQNMMGIEEILLLWFINILIKSPQIEVLIMKLKKMNNQLKNCTNHLLENLKKVYSSFKDLIWCVDLADKRLLSKFHKVIRFLSCVIDIFSKYAFVIPLKDEKDVTITNVFQKIPHDSKRKPSKIWVGKGIEIYIRSMK